MPRCRPRAARARAGNIDVDAAAEHGDGAAERRQRAAVACAVDARREPARDRQAALARDSVRTAPRFRGRPSSGCGCRRSRAAAPPAARARGPSTQSASGASASCARRCGYAGLPNVTSARCGAGEPLRASVRWRRSSGVLSLRELRRPTPHSSSSRGGAATSASAEPQRFSASSQGRGETCCAAESSVSQASVAMAAPPAAPGTWTGYGLRTVSSSANGVVASMTRA